MIKVGVTGSIASGKSTVAQILSLKKYPIFNADKEVLKIYKKKSFKKLAHKKLGANKKSDIKILLKESPKKLKVIEKLIHPLVRKELKRFIKKFKSKKLLIFEIPLLVESKLMKNFHSIILVNCKKKTRLKRFIQRGKDKKLFEILENRQLKPGKKRKFCNYVINNNNSLKILKKNVNILRNKL